MDIEFHCPHCRATLHARAEARGRRQFCAECGRKLRVPSPGESGMPARTEPASAAPFIPMEGAPTVGAPPGADQLAIEFLCPRCEAKMRAPAQAVGQKGYCHECGGKVRVPQPVAPQSETAPQPAPPAPSAHPAQRAEPASRFAIALDAHDVEITPAELLRRRLQRQRRNVVVPVASIAVLAIVLVYFLWRPAQRIEGSLEAQRISDPQIGPFRIDRTLYGLSGEKLDAVLEDLAREPLAARTESSIIEFHATEKAIYALLTAGPKHELVRIDPAGHVELARFVRDSEGRFEKSRRALLEKSVPEFVQALAGRGAQQGNLEGLAEFRHTVGLASTVSGAGAVLCALCDGEAYRCVAQDREGRLFFALPVKTRSFELVFCLPAEAGRTDLPRFDGKLQVTLADEPIQLRKEREDPRRAIIKKMLGPKARYADDDDDPEK